MKIMFEGKYYTCTPSTSEEVGDHIHLEEYFDNSVGHLIFFSIGFVCGAGLAVSLILG